MIPVAYQIELAAFRPELGEVVDDGGVPEKGLHLVDVEPGGDSQLEVVVHAVSHGLQSREHPENAHVGREVVQVDVRDAVLEGDVATAC